MKYSVKQEEYETTETIDGKTRPVTLTRAVKVPKLPRDTKALILNGVLGVIGAITVTSVVWSTVAIGELLGGHPLSYAVSVSYDACWIAVMGLEWVFRLQSGIRDTLRKTGWGFLSLTVIMLFLNGLMNGGVLYAFGGAFFSVMAKGLWTAFMRTQEAALSEGQRQWIAQEYGEIHSAMAVAEVKEDLAKMKDRMAARALARQQANDEYAVLTDGSSTQVLRDQNVKVPQISEVPAGPVRDQIEPAPKIHMVKGSATAVIRDLIGQGITDTGEIRTALSANGTKVPDPSYIRRLVREARTATDVNQAGPYL